MTWKELSGLLYTERQRLFGSVAHPRSLSWTLENVREDMSGEEFESREGVDSAARHFARQREILSNLSMEEHHFLRARFDWAVALTSLLYTTAEFACARIIQEPTAQEEDLIEWALITTWHYESFALEQTTLEEIHWKAS